MSNNQNFDNSDNGYCGYVDILFHDVRWEYDDEKILELPKSEEEHIKEMIIEGYVSGELNYYNPDTDEEIRGYWNIDFTCNQCGQRSK